LIDIIRGPTTSRDGPSRPCLVVARRSLAALAAVALTLTACGAAPADTAGKAITVWLMDGDLSDKAVAAINSAFETGIRSPLDTAILLHAPADVAGYQKIDEIPFDFERRRLSVVVETTGGESRRLLITKGACEPIIERSTAFETADQITPLDETTRQACAAVHERMAEDGLRVLAVAYRWLEPRATYSRDDEADLVLAGCAILEAIRRAFPCERLRVADRGLREGMLVQMMREDGVWGDAAAAVP